MEPDLDELNMLDAVASSVVNNENELFEKIMSWRNNNTLCCGKRCFAVFNIPEMQQHCIEIEMYKNRGRGSFQSFVMSCYFCSHTTKKCMNWRLPCLSIDLCKKAFCLFLGLHPSTFERWVALAPHRATILRDHLLSGRESNHRKALARNNVVNFVLKLADKEGLPWPQSNVNSTLLLLPAIYSKRNTHALYLEYVQLSEADAERAKALSVSLSTFWDILKCKDLVHVRFSKKMKGLCDTCALFREKLRHISDAELENTLVSLNDHLTFAGELRDIYRTNVARAVTAWKAAADVRLSFACISFDYAVMLKLPVFDEETQAGYHAHRLGLDVNLFGIVNEGRGHQHNVIYYEGYKHGSEHVCSMLNFYLDKMERRVGLAKTLSIFSDSCCGQNRNNIVLGFLIRRAERALNDRIEWNFLAVGHTKFAPDRGFGHIRCKEKVCHCFDGDELLQMISDSSTSNTGVEMDDGCFRQWKSWTAERYTKWKGIKKDPIVQIVIQRTDELISDGVYKVSVSKTVVKALPVNDLKCEFEVVHGPALQKPQQYSASRFEETVPILPRRPLAPARRAQLLGQVRETIPANNMPFWDELLGQPDPPPVPVALSPVSTAVDPSEQVPSVVQPVADATPDFDSSPSLLSPSPSSRTSTPPSMLSTPSPAKDISSFVTTSSERSAHSVLSLRFNTGERRLDNELANLPEKRRRLAKNSE